MRTNNRKETYLVKEMFCGTLVDLTNYDWKTRTIINGISLNRITAITVLLNSFHLNGHTSLSHPQT